MSQETALSLNTNTLQGFTAKRGNAWHYREELQGDESNHYEGAIPVADVERRLFNWDALGRPNFTQHPCGAEEADSMFPDGQPFRWLEDPDRKSIVRSDTGETLGVFKRGYEIHGYHAWLVQNVQNLMDAGLSIGSAGLLRNGAVAWVQIEMEETVENAQGVAHRPFLLATTSLDGSLSTTYLRGTQLVVCDNTLSAALWEEDILRVRVKHTKNSGLKIAEARQALDIVAATANNFDAQVEALCAREVTDKQWFQFLDLHSPLTDAKGEPKIKAALTQAQNRRDRLTMFYKSDARCAPWTGTAFGVVQTINTDAHHGMTAKNGRIAERNMDRAVSGGVDKLDRETYAMIDRVLIGAV